MDVIEQKPPKVSIIVPIFNAEAYIEKGLDSLCDQTLHEIEIIVINDGSTDNSHSIIVQYMNRDERIKYYVQENQGPSVARNVGISIACGEYIGFVDSDDWAEPNMFEELYNHAKLDDADLAVCGRRDVIEDRTNHTSGNLQDECFSIKEMGIDHFLLYKRDELGAIVWNKIFRNQIIQDHHIRFETNNNIFNEDILFNLYFQLYCDKITCTTQVLYNYQVRPGSLTTKSKPCIENKIINAALFFHNKLIQESLLQECNDFDAIFMLQMVGNAYKNAYLSNQNSYRAILKTYREVAGQSHYRERLTQSLRTRMPSEWKLKAFVYLIKPYWIAAYLTYLSLRIRRYI